MLANTWEIINGKKVVFQPPHPATWFRAFDNLDEGVTHHLDLLRNKRYKIAWSAVEQGDPGEFARLLKQAGYYTAPVEAYVNLIIQHFNKFMKTDTFEKTLEEVKLELKPVEHKIKDAVFITSDVIVDRKQNQRLNLSTFTYLLTQLISYIRRIFSK